MDPVLVLLLALVAAIVAVAWWWRRRRTEPVDDEWVLPPDEAGASGFPGSAPAPGSPEAVRPPVFDRDFLLNRDRTFDPGRWDNTPDTTAEGDLPRFFDREYLEGLRKDETGDQAG